MIVAATRFLKRSPGPLRVARAIEAALDSENREVEDLAGVFSGHHRKHPSNGHLPLPLSSRAEAEGGWTHLDAITDPAMYWYLDRESSLEEIVVTLYYGNASVSRMEKIVKALWGGEVDIDFVSQHAGKIAQRILGWLRRPISGPYPYVFLQTMLLKAGKGSTRTGSRIFVATGVSLAGIREVLALRLAPASDVSARRAFLEDLRARGLRGTELFLGENEPQLMEAVKESFPSARYQGDFAQMEREILQTSPATEILENANALAAIRDDDSPASAEGKLVLLMKKLRRQRNFEAARRVAVALPYLYSFSCFPRVHWPRLRTNSPFVKVMRQSRRLIRTGAVDSSPEDQLLILAARWRWASREWARRKFL
jgi:putative transposase